MNYILLYIGPQFEFQRLQQQIQVSGIVDSGFRPGCYILTDDNGVNYDLKGLVLTDSGFGTRVTATGILRPDLPSTCRQGIPFDVISITRQIPLPAQVPIPVFPPMPNPMPIPIPIPIQRFACIRGQCIQSPFGEFSTEGECRRTCGLRPLPLPGSRQLSGRLF